MKTLQELFENAVPRPLVVAKRVAPKDEPEKLRWVLRAGADRSIVVASLKAFDEQDEADARLLAHAYNHFPALLKAAEDMLHGYAGARARMRTAVDAAREVKK